MIELRWIWNREPKIDKPLVLQYRFMQLNCDASGSLTAMGAAWSDWQDVPTVQRIASNIAQESGKGEG